jgi:Apolipoprotein N-acyltransferase N-terminal domain
MVLKLSNSALVAFCLAMSAALFFLGTGLAPVWVLTWLASIPVLYISPRVPAAEAFFIGAAAYALGGLNEWSYSRTVLPTWLVVLLLLGTACIFGVAVLLFRSCIVRKKLWQATLIVPVFWVAFEYVTAVVSVHGTFGNISYSQMNFFHPADRFDHWHLGYQRLHILFCRYDCCNMQQRSWFSKAPAGACSLYFSRMRLRIWNLASCCNAQKLAHGKSGSHCFGRIRKYLR